MVSGYGAFYSGNNLMSIYNFSQLMLQGMSTEVGWLVFTTVSNYTMYNAFNSNPIRAVG